MSGVIVPDNDPAAIESGSYWNGIEQTGSPIIVTFSFPTSLPSYDTNATLEANGFGPTTGGSFSAFTLAEQTETIAALNEWAAMSGLIFVEVTPGQGDINFTNVDFNTAPGDTAFAGVGFNPFGAHDFSTNPYFSSDLDIAGDVFMNSRDQNADGTVNMGTLLHEIGHAIGLKHPDQTEFGASGVDHDQILDPMHDAASLTIMSETADTGVDADSLKSLDTLAAQAIYGSAAGEVIASTSTIVTGSDSVSSWSWNPITQILTQTALHTNETVHGTSVNDIINGLAGDTLIALDGTDMLIGAGGGDTLIGGPGIDTLIGGPGGNTFVVNSTVTTVDDHLNPGGADTVYATVDFTLPANTNSLIISGPDGLTATGNSQHDFLHDEGSLNSTLTSGTGGADLFGGSGADTLIGEPGGTNNFHIFNPATTIIDNNTAPGDEVFTNINLTLPANVTAGAIFAAGTTLTANNLADSLFGNPNLGTTLIGGSGNDEIVGEAGHDTIVAGTGIDSIFDTEGNNTFVFKTLANAPTGPSPTAISGFNSGSDKIDLSGIASSTGQALSFSTATSFSDMAGQVIAVNSGGNTLVEGDTTGAGVADFEILLYADPTTPVLTASDFILGSAPICFLHGTHILTPTGEVLVENLKIGDFVVTRFRGIQPIKWIGRQSYDSRFIAKNRAHIPVHLQAGALADHMPARDLYISPGHSMLVGDQLVLARSLVNGVTIRQDDCQDEIHYFQIELETHDCVIAEGAWSETFADGPGLREQFHNAAEFAELYPDHPPPSEVSLCAPRPEKGPKLDAALRPVVTRTAAMVKQGPLQGYIDRIEAPWTIEGWAQDTDNPELPVVLEILLDEQMIGTTLACDHRQDLQDAGIGQGRCAFFLTSPIRLRTEMLSKLRIRRAVDLAEIQMSPECRANIEEMQQAKTAPALRRVA
jgi:Ca2+-binding RTX toxin-like protein